MNRENGFTLIELIAVIIVLAVIALISTPLIMDVINNSKQGSFKTSSKGIVEAAKQGYKRALLNDFIAEYTEYQFENGARTKVEGNVELEYDGSSPKSGNIIIDEEGDISLAFYDGTNCAKKRFGENNITVEKIPKAACNVQRGYEEEILNGAYPEIDSGMIPVYFDGNVVKKANAKEKWYSYEEKKWANVVLVKSSVRDEYREMDAGENIDEADILAYLVWIPRYKYKLFNIAGAIDTGNERPIEITFESKTSSKSMVIANGNYYTHPAFTFGDEELNGFWVGKFETSVDKESTCYNSMNAGNCNNSNQSPRILPNVKSLMYQQVANQFLTAQKFTSQTYGISSESKMMKNDEWGAVAYLSHSIYGINDEVRINNYTISSNTLTGCGASVSNDVATPSSTCDIVYGSVSDDKYPQSTTGNITGIFDMAGGLWEYVMGVRGDSDGNPLTGSGIEKNSGFNGKYGVDEGSLTDGIIDFPSSQYYNVYKNGNFNTSCNGTKCYGIGKIETNKWYGDASGGVDTTYVWVVRGGYYNSGIEAGIFDMRSSQGIVTNYTFRTVVIVNK